MSKQRIIKDEMWDDEWFYDLDPSEKLVWVFLLTNPRGNISGIYKLNKKWASQCIGLDLDVFNTIIKRFVKDEKIVDVESWIGLINFHKHLAYRNASVAQGILRLYKERTGCPQALDSLWVTLLNSTLLYLTEGEEKSSQLLKEIKQILMGWKPYNENDHSDDIPSINDEGEIEKKPTKVKRTYKPIYLIFEEVLGKKPNNWLVNVTQQKCAENLFTERGIDAVKNALQFYKAHKDNEFCPQITSPSDLDAKWTKLATFKQKYGN